MICSIFPRCRQANSSIEKSILMWMLWCKKSWKTYRERHRRIICCLKARPRLSIGLYISLEIVKRHGGQIWVESKKGEGTTFHFTLPLFQERKRQVSL